MEEWVKRPAKREDGCLSCRLGEAVWPWDVLSDRGYGGQSMQGQGEITCTVYTH